MVFAEEFVKHLLKQKNEEELRKRAYKFIPLLSKGQISSSLFIEAVTRKIDGYSKISNRILLTSAGVIELVEFLARNSFINLEEVNIGMITRCRRKKDLGTSETNEKRSRHYSRNWPSPALKKKLSHKAEEVIIKEDAEERTKRNNKCGKFSYKHTTISFH